jgi:Right handed beta helix region
MTKIASLSIAAALIACGLSAAPAHTLANRTSVSGKGTDSGTCGRAAPCRTFAFALTQTAAGGEIDVLDPAGYGAMTITKAISIVNDGVGVAGIQVGSGNGVTINAGASDSVHLRGLTIEGLRSEANGIEFTTGGNLEIENCVVRGFLFRGIAIAPSTSSSFSVSNTIASNNDVGIFVQPTGSAVVTGVLSKVTANDNFLDGIDVNSEVTTGASFNVTIVDSVASNNGEIDAEALSVSGHPAAAAMLRNVVASNNKAGLDAGPNTILRVAHSVVTGNLAGVETNSGTIQSFGDNDIDGNGHDNFGSLTPLAMH